MFDNSVEPTRYQFRVPGVGGVVVEIGDVMRTGDFGHSYPEYRVTINGDVVDEGTDWGVPAHKATDDMDAALSLLFWIGHDMGNEDLALWVSTREEIRNALRAPGRDEDPRAIVRAGYAGQLG